MRKFVILFVLVLAGLWLSALAFNHVHAWIGWTFAVVVIAAFVYYLIKFTNIEIKKQNEKSNS